MFFFLWLVQFDFGELKSLIFKYLNPKKIQTSMHPTILENKDGLRSWLMVNSASSAPRGKPLGMPQQLDLIHMQVNFCFMNIHLVMVL